MEWFQGNWPIVLVVLAVALVFTGLLRRLLKLAFMGAAIGVIALIIWPLVAS